MQRTTHPGRSPAMMASQHYSDYPDSARTPRAPPYPTSDAYPSRHSSSDNGDPREPEPVPPRTRQSPPPPPPTAKSYQDAVSHAFDQHHISGMDQNLVAQITQNVLQELRRHEGSGSGGTPTTAVPRSQPLPSAYPAAPMPQPVPSSPPASFGASPPDLGRQDFNPSSPTKHERREPTPPEGERRAPSRASVGSEGAGAALRPRGPTRLSTSTDATTLEKIWGQLFDEEGRPTARLGQFLRGLAVHLVSTPSATESTKHRSLTCRRSRIGSPSTAWW